MKFLNTVLLLLLAAAAVFGFIYYQKYTTDKDVVLVTEKKVSALEEKVAQLNKENTGLRNQTQKDAEALKALQKAETRSSVLKDSLDAREKSFAELKDEFDAIKKESEKQAKTISELKADLSAKEEKLQKSASEAASLKDEMGKIRKEIKALKGTLSEVEKQKARLQSEIDQTRSTYNDMVLELKKEIGGREVTISQLREKLSITFVDRVLFEFGKATITPQGRNILNKVGGALKKVKNKVIRVVGHTDNKPIIKEQRDRFPSNWELSTARAAAVVRYFQKEIGLNPKNMEAVGRSFYEPIATNRTQKGRAQNRRVNITVAPRLK